jgi:spore coat polysaccharide biosynthesis protein SpsF (cytidylyltransferase family)
MRTIAIIQARMTSSRLPGKVLAELNGVPLLAYMIHRVRLAESLDDVWVATTENTTDDSIVAACSELGVNVFRGAEFDVLERFFKAAEYAQAEIVIRLTADCPMMDPALIDEFVNEFRRGNCHYLSNVSERTYPDGLDVEVFDINTLRTTHEQAATEYDREHVTSYIYGGPKHCRSNSEFKLRHLLFTSDFSHVRWTVDQQKDLDNIRQIVARLPMDFSWLDALSLVTREPDLLRIAKEPEAYQC